MNVYITYDRYEHDEWYSIYRIETNCRRAMKAFKTEDLMSFLDYGPDDCHSFQLQRVVMSAEQYRALLYLYEYGSEQDITDFMIPIFDEEEFEVDTIYSTDGCTDNCEILQMFAEEYGLDIDDWTGVTDYVDTHEEEFYAVMRKYISMNY